MASASRGPVRKRVRRHLVLVAQSRPTLCDPTDCSPPVSSVQGILQARILEWIAIPFSRGSSQPMDQTLVSCIAGKLFTIWATGKTSRRHLALLNSIFPSEKKKEPAVPPQCGAEDRIHATAFFPQISLIFQAPREHFLQRNFMQWYEGAGLYQRISC